MNNIKPYWGSISSNVDWCEKNYVISPYFAEFFNTITSLPMIYLGFFGLLCSWKLENNIRFCLSFIALLLVGIGSTLFHMTLKYYLQLLDEIPMIIGSLIFVYIMIDLYFMESSIDQNNKKLILNWFFLPFLLIYGILTFIIMGLYSYSPLPMNLSYVFMVFFLVIRSTIIFYQSKDPIIHFYFALSFFSYIFGAICWIIEKQFCHYFIVTQYLHAIWHLTSGYGTYIFITWCCYIQMKLSLLNPKMKLKYFIIPYVEILKKL